MKLDLYREPTVSLRTFGMLYVDGHWECHTLEDAIRPAKIDDVTAIPAGTYRVVITMSPRFRRRLPLLVGVPDYEGVRIHAGNRVSDTSGCILPGRVRGPDCVLESRAALAKLFAKLEAAAPPITITIHDPGAR